MAQPMFLSENGHCVPNKIPKILKIFKSVDGAKSRGACFGTKELDHPFLVIQMAVIWSQAMSQIKAVWITQEWMIQFLSAETCPSAFGTFHTLEYFQNNGNFIWNTVSIFWKNLGWAMATLAKTMAMMTVQTTLTTTWMMLQRFYDGLWQLVIITIQATMVIKWQRLNRAMPNNRIA